MFGRTNNVAMTFTVVLAGFAALSAASPTPAEVSAINDMPPFDPDRRMTDEEIAAALGSWDFGVSSGPLNSTHPRGEPADDDTTTNEQHGVLERRSHVFCSEPTLSCRTNDNSPPQKDCELMYYYLSNRWEEWDLSQGIGRTYAWAGICCFRATNKSPGIAYIGGGDTAWAVSKTIDQCSGLGKTSAEGTTNGCPKRVVSQRARIDWSIFKC